MAKKKSDIWMPFYIGDFLADTMHLSTEQKGAYALLLFHSWRTGPLPADENMLRRIAGLDLDAWSIAWPILKVFFRVNEEGDLTQARLERERAGWDKKKAASQAKATLASAARWRNGMLDAPTSNASGNPSGNAQGMHMHSPLSLSLPVLKSSSRNRSESDPRFAKFKALIESCWPADSEVAMPWGAAENAQLSQLLKANSGISEDGFGRVLRNRVASAKVNLTEPPSRWLAHISRWASGPLDEYGKPLKSPPPAKRTYMGGEHVHPV